MATYTKYRGGPSLLDSHNVFAWLRFFFGPGYRVYYTIKSNAVVILLAGGDKATQTKNIENAKMLLNEVEE